MQEVRRKLDRAAGLNVPILILGESGTGKEILAHFVHNRSPWRDGPFVKVNCPAIPGTLLESELFGFQKGAFTGAHASKPGRMELAQGGTLFMDEIAELDASLQAKLLHVLQDGHFMRIGDHEDKRMDARVICATNRQLPHEIEAGHFRADLFYRVNVISIQLPALRERREDVPYLVEYLRQQFNRRFHRDAAAVSEETVALLQQRDWPGNIRELENAVERIIVTTPGEYITLDQVLPGGDKKGYRDGLSLKEMMAEAEAEILQQAMRRHRTTREVAAALGISQASAARKMKEARNRLERNF